MIKPPSSSLFTSLLLSHNLCFLNTARRDDLVTAVNMIVEGTLVKIREGTLVKIRGQGRDKEVEVECTMVTNKKVHSTENVSETMGNGNGKTHSRALPQL
jgi:hypothetical protein